MRSFLKRPMFRRGGPIKQEGLSTMRNNFFEGGEMPVPMPKPEQNQGISGFDERFSMNEDSIRNAMGSPKDTRMLRYLSRAAGNLGGQRGGTALQRISRAMSGDPMEKLFNETDQFRSRDQGIKNAALQRTLTELDRDELRAYEESQENDPSKDNRTANQRDFEFMENEFTEQEKPIYNEDGSLTDEFKARFMFYKTGKEIVEKTETEYALANPSGSARDLKDQIAFNQAQRIKQFHKGRADEAGLSVATVDEYIPGQPLEPFVLYMAEDGVQYGDSMIEGVAYVFRDGSDVKFLDINFEEIKQETDE
tara:strand:- start:12722 stop:13645 length:924 start_codon:yes stop_codon:yes gene_type:complete